MDFFSPRKFLRKLLASKRGLLRKKRELEKTLGVKIKNEDYFSEALTHRSALSAPSHEEENSNERMEFLGDAILNFLVAEFLYGEFPELDEGQMTRLRSLFVNQHALAEFASKINLSAFLALSTSAQQAIEKGHETIVSDALEAVIAAILSRRRHQGSKEVCCSDRHLPDEKHIDPVKCLTRSTGISRVHFLSWRKRVDLAPRDTVCLKKRDLIMTGHSQLRS